MKSSRYIDLHIHTSFDRLTLRNQELNRIFFLFRGPIAQHTLAEENLWIHCAKDANCVVELGVAEGACARAIALKAQTTTSIYLVDPYNKRFPWFLDRSKLVARYYVSQAKHPNVHWLYHKSQDVVRVWNQPIDCLLIDANHSYEACMQDWKDWSVWVKKGGFIILHDANLFEGGWTKAQDGPVRVADYIRQNESSFSLVKTLDSSVVFQKIN